MSAPPAGPAAAPVAAPPAAPPPFAARLVWGLAALFLVLHVAADLVAPYGFQRDEFLYFAMGDHLRLWRMDFPPFIAIAARAARLVAGDAMAGIRLVPNLAASALVVLAAALARRLGGGRLAQGFAALAVVASVFFQRAGTLFQPTILDALWWTLGFYALARLARADPPAGRWWLLLGVAGGIGLLTKFSILFLGFGILVALLVTRHRRALTARWPWVTLLLALAIGSPSLVGQVRLGWPVVEQMRDLQAGQLAHVGIATFFLTQLMFGPAMLVAAGGAVALLFAPALRPFRVVGWSCVAVWALLVALHGKAYYVGATYPVLFAAGGVALEAVRRVRLRAWLAGTAVWATGLYGLLVLPLGLPFLAPAPMQRYVHAIGAVQALRDNQGHLLRLPQDYADMLGWRARAAAVAQACRTLSPLERAQAVVIANNWGEAGALEFYAPRYGLPPVVSASGSFWFFGPGARPGAVAVTLGESRDALARLYDSVQAGPHLVNPWTVREEQDLTVYIGRGPKATLQAVWPREAGRN